MINITRKNQRDQVELDLMSIKLIHHILQKSSRIESMINMFPGFVNIKDGNGEWIHANKFAQDLFEVKNMDFKNKKDSQIASISPFYYECLHYCEETDEQTWNTRKVSLTSEIIPCVDGSVLKMEIIKIPLFYCDGNRKGMVVVANNKRGIF